MEKINKIREIFWKNYFAEQVLEEKAPHFAQILNDM